MNTIRILENAQRGIAVEGDVAGFLVKALFARTFRLVLDCGAKPFSFLMLSCPETCRMREETVCCAIVMSPCTCLPWCRL
jgi:hypothetical protein